MEICYYQWLFERFDGFPFNNGLFMSGVAKIRNTSLKDRVRSVITHSNLPESLLWEALKTAAYINKVLPKETTKPPLELWTHKMSSLKHLHVLGLSSWILWYWGYKFCDPTTMSIFESEMLVSLRKLNLLIFESNNQFYYQLVNLVIPLLCQFGYHYSVWVCWNF